jgi:hypothetical protein
MFWNAEVVRSIGLKAVPVLDTSVDKLGILLLVLFFIVSARIHVISKHRKWKFWIPENSC